MSENATHIIIHHYFENSQSSDCAGVACCVILIVVIVILFLIVAGVIIYIVVYLSRHRVPRRPRQHLTTRELHGYDNAIDDTSSCNAATAATSTERNYAPDDNVESIPMTTFRTTSDNIQSIPVKTFRTTSGNTRRHQTEGSKRQDSSDSSAGLYDVLFPEQEEGEVLCDPPSRLMTFAGQVYPSGPGPDGPVAGPSGQNLDSDSLVWDYFQPVNTPANSDAGSDADPGVIENICWV